MTSLLLQRGAEPSADTLITAVRYSPDQTEMLLKAGADPNTPEPRTPLRYSIKSTNVHVVKLLLDYGAVPHSDHLYLAIRRKSIDIADILWRWGAQLTSRQHLDSLGKWAQLPAIAKFSAECYWTPASHRDCAPWLRKVVIQVLLCWKFSAIQTSSPCSYTIGHLHKDLLIGILCLLSPSSTRPHKL
ncbi:hypothetical protein Pelo_10448 [Pelomyxa schiedti]|nr:hypothetical protein Pelo_10448 [Pelomyxa schiedti]